VERSQARFLDVYEHLYDDSIFGDTVSTHYVVLGYQLCVEPRQLALPDLQHQEYNWWRIDEMSASEQVHENSRAYLARLNVDW
jgi:colanic acid biosynthesis protein WcaH